MQWNWYKDYFGVYARRIVAYLDIKDRIFVVEDEYRDLPEEHNCDAMGCASIGPHIDSVYLNAKKYNDLQAENAKLKEALERIQTWAQAYPLEVFPKPDLKKAHEVLKAEGMTLDSISADSMRHVLDGIKDIVKQALQGEQDG